MDPDLAPVLGKGEEDDESQLGLKLLKCSCE